MVQVFFSLSSGWREKEMHQRWTNEQTLCYPSHDTGRCLDLPLETFWRYWLAGSLPLHRPNTRAIHSCWKHLRRRTRWRRGSAESCPKNRAAAAADDAGCSSRFRPWSYQIEQLSSRQSLRVREEEEVPIGTANACFAVGVLVCLLAASYWLTGVEYAGERSLKSKRRCSQRTASESHLVLYV